jgi:hypothetical protein
VKVLYNYGCIAISCAHRVGDKLVPGKTKPPADPRLVCEVCLNAVACKRHAGRSRRQCYYNTDGKVNPQVLGSPRLFPCTAQRPTANSPALFATAALRQRSSARRWYRHQQNAVMCCTKRTTAHLCGVRAVTALSWSCECATWLLALHCASNASCWLTPATSCVPHKPVSAVATPSRVLLTQWVTHAECLLAVPRHKTCMLRSKVSHARTICTVAEVIGLALPSVDQKEFCPDVAIMRTYD